MQKNEKRIVLFRMVKNGQPRIYFKNSGLFDVQIHKRERRENEWKSIT